MRPPLKKKEQQLRPSANQGWDQGFAAMNERDIPHYNVVGDKHTQGYVESLQRNHRLKKYLDVLYV